MNIAGGPSYGRFALAPQWGEPNWIRLAQGTQLVVADSTSLSGLSETIGAYLDGPSTSVHYLIQPNVPSLSGGTTFTWNIYGRFLGQRVLVTTGSFTAQANQSFAAPITATAQGQAVDHWELGLVKQATGVQGSVVFQVAGIAFGREVMG